MIRIIVALLIASFCADALAEKMDLDTHSLVINKLELALEDSSGSPSDNQSIILRLADLYSERARLKSLKEGAKSCDNCLESEQDRRKALSLYRSIFESTGGEVQGTILLQMAQLHRLLGEDSQAKKLYERVVRLGKRRYSTLLIGQSHSGLGEMAFQQGNFKSSLKHFERALKIKDTPRKGFLVYRKAWSLLNTGRTEAATRTLESLLSNDNLLQFDGASSSFREDVSKDYASFLARGKITKSEIANLSRLSPESIRRDNLFYLGQETDRVGKKRESLYVWDEFLKVARPTEIERLEIQTRVAQIRYDLNHKNTALKEYEKALQLWQDNGCDDPVVCEGLRSRLRNFVINWNKLEKKSPSKNLWLAYEAFLKRFPNDFEMHYWSALVARQQSHHKGAIEAYHKASLSSEKELKSSVSQRKKEAQKIFEGSLLGEIEMAEASGNHHLRERAYKYYLEKNPNGEKALEIRYQLAQVAYEQKDYQKSAYLFKDVVGQKGSLALRKKAADLALDSLALLKDHSRLEKWGMEFADALPSGKAAYLGISRKASINLVAQQINSSSNLEDAKKKIQTLPLTYVDQQDKHSYWKNRLLLAEKTKDISEIHQAGSEFLKLKSLSEPEQHWAQALKVFAYELEFKFAAAFDLARKTQFKGLSHIDHTLKLAQLAELAGEEQTAEKLYKKFIDDTPSRRQANVIRAKLTRQARYPWAQLEQYLGKLASTPDILASLSLEVFARFSNYRKAEKVLKYKNILRYPEGRTLARFVFFKDFWKFNSEIREHRISTRSDHHLQKTLKKRISLLSQAEKWANRAVSAKDWTLQIVTLDALARENQRLYNTLLRLKPPRHLNSKQRKEYAGLLKRQASPYKNTAEQVNKKLGEFWSNSQAVESLETDYRKASNEVRSLVKDELNVLNSRAPEWMQKKIARIFRHRDNKPSSAKVASAYERVKSKPFHSGYLKELYEIEKQREENPTMISYLGDRLQTLKGVN